MRVARTTKTLGQRDDRSSIVKDQRAPHGVDRLTLDMARRLDISASFLQKDMLIRVRSLEIAIGDFRGITAAAGRSKSP